MGIKSMKDSDFRDNETLEQFEREGGNFLSINHRFSCQLGSIEFHLAIDICNQLLWHRNDGLRSFPP